MSPSIRRPTVRNKLLYSLTLLDIIQIITALKHAYIIRLEQSERSITPPTEDSNAAKSRILLEPGCGHFDGAYRARTCDPLLVRQMLSQLS